jgi:hypothetical protein
MGEKKCPQCAELVQADAKVCRFCNWSFSKGQAPLGAASKNSFQSCLGCVGIGIVGLVILSAIGSNSGDNNSTSNSPATALSSEPPVEVTAKVLAKAFDDNEAAAMETYGNRTLAVTGTLTGVDLDLTDDPVVKLESGMFLSVQAQFSKDNSAGVAALKKGQAVTVVCQKLSEVMGSALLDDCSLPAI